MPTPSDFSGRTEFIRVFAEAYLRGKTGSVTTTAGRSRRVFHLRDGHVIGLESDRPQDSLESVLVKGKFISDLNLRRLLRAATGGEPLDALLVRHARVDRDALHKRLVRWMMGAVSTPVGWPRSDTTFTAVKEHTDLVERQAIGVHIPVLRALWRGVGKHMTAGEAKTELSALPPNPLLAGSSLPIALRELDLDSSHQRLGELLAAGRRTDELIAEVGDRAGTVVRLLWFLEAAGAIRRGIVPTSRPAPALRGRRPTAAQMEATRVPGAPSPGPLGRGARPSGGRRVHGELDKLVAAVEDGHDRRMQGDYYRFLMIGRESPAQRIESTCDRLQQRWTSTLARTDLPDDTRERVAELISVLPLVHRTLVDPKRRAEYDRRLAAGRAPTVGGIRGADTSVLESTKRAEGGGASPGDLAAATELIDDGDFERAAAILDHLRMHHPSEPDIMAALGWARFHIGGEAGADAAEDYLRLALTFEPSHAKALEYASRVAMESGRNDVAESRLRRLLARDPSVSWARKALRDLQAT